MRIRSITPADQPRLWELLHVALWDLPPAELRPRTGGLAGLRRTCHLMIRELG